MLFSTTVMDGPRDYTKWNKSERETNNTWYHSYMESKAQQKCKTKTDSQICGCQGGRRWGKEKLGVFSYQM